MPAPLRPTGATDPETRRLFDAVRDALRKLGAKPYLDAKAFAVTLAAGTTTLSHGFGRAPRGWLLHSIVGSSDARVASSADITATAIILTSTAAGSCVLELW